MPILGEAIGAAIGTIIFWSAFAGLTLIVCGIADLAKGIRRRRRGRELEQHTHRWDWPPL